MLMMLVRRVYLLRAQKKKEEEERERIQGDPTRFDEATCAATKEVRDDDDASAPSLHSLLLSNLTSFVCMYTDCRSCQRNGEMHSH